MFLIGISYHGQGACASWPFVLYYCGHPPKPPTMPENYLRISLGADLIDNEGITVGTITNSYYEDNRTVVVIDDDYEIELRSGDLDEVIDLIHGIGYYRLTKGEDTWRTLPLPGGGRLGY